MKATGSLAWQQQWLLLTNVYLELDRPRRYVPHAASSRDHAHIYILTVHVPVVLPVTRVTSQVQFGRWPK